METGSKARSNYCYLRFWEHLVSFGIQLCYIWDCKQTIQRNIFLYQNFWSALLNGYKSFLAVSWSKLNSDTPDCSQVLVWRRAWPGMVSCRQFACVHISFFPHSHYWRSGELTNMDLGSSKPVGLRWVNNPRHILFIGVDKPITLPLRTISV